MRRGIVVSLTVAGLLAVWFVQIAPVSVAAGESVSFCHRSNSVSNPYTLKSSDVDSIIQQGHGSHTGPVFPADNWGDIIPPFDYSGGHFPGLNWPGGADILNGGCEVRETEVPPEETTTTSAAPTTPAPTETTTATTVPAESSTVPGSSSPTTETTTSLPVGGSSTSAPASSTAPTVTAGASSSVATSTPGVATTLPATTTGGVTTTTGAAGVVTPSTLTPPTSAPVSEYPPPVTELDLTAGAPPPRVEVVTVVPVHKLVVLGYLSPALLLRLKAELDAARLAQSGTDNSELVVIGIVAVGFGIASIWFSTRRRVRWGGTGREW